MKPMTLNTVRTAMRLIIMVLLFASRLYRTGAVPRPGEQLPIRSARFIVACPRWSLDYADGHGRALLSLVHDADHLPSSVAQSVAPWTGAVELRAHAKGQAVFPTLRRAAQGSDAGSTITPSQEAPPRCASFDRSTRARRNQGLARNDQVRLLCSDRAAHKAVFQSVRVSQSVKRNRAPLHS